MAALRADVQSILECIPLQQLFRIFTATRYTTIQS